MTDTSCGHASGGAGHFHARELQLQGVAPAQLSRAATSLILALSAHGSVGVVHTRASVEEWRLHKGRETPRQLRLNTTDDPARRMLLAQAFFQDAWVLLHLGGARRPQALSLEVGDGAKGLHICLEGGEPCALEVLPAMVEQLVARWSQTALPLMGLVLSGGKSRRMGRDKALLEWEGEALVLRQARLLKEWCDQVFLSARSGQGRDALGPTVLEDRHSCPGPIAGILTALEENPQAAWLVLACDLPLVDNSVLQALVAGRDPMGHGTAFRSPHDKRPEALCAIWEPAARALILRALAADMQCPRRILGMGNTRLLDPGSAHFLFNVNRPEDLVQARQGRQLPPHHKDAP